MDSEYIKSLRKKLGVSQEGFARQVGVSLATVVKWEKGSFKPSLLAREKIKCLINKE